MNTPQSPEDPEVEAAFAALEAAEARSRQHGRHQIKLWHLIVLIAGLGLLPVLTEVLLGGS